MREAGAELARRIDRLSDPDPCRPRSL